MEQLTGQREEPEPFELSTEEPIEKASIKSRLLSNLVAQYVGWCREAPLEQRFPLRGEQYAPAIAGFGSVKSYICAAEFRNATQMQALVSLGSWSITLSLWPLNYFSR